MKTTSVLFFTLITFLISSASYSQKNDSLIYSNGIYSADLKIATSSNDTNENIRIEGMLVYQVKKEKVVMALYMPDLEGWMFDIISSKLSIDVDIDTETLKFRADPDHIAVDFSAFGFDISADDLLKFNNSKKVILNMILINGGNGEKKEVPVKIDLKPEKTYVYRNFYKIILKEKENK